MKKIIITAALALVFGAMQVEAQTQAEIELQKKELRKQAVKDAKKQTKSDEKDGWKSMSTRPLQTQYEELNVLRGLVDNDGNPIYIEGHGDYVSNNKNVAFKNACKAARMDIVNNLESEIAIGTSLVEGDKNGVADVSNAEEAKTIASGKLQGTKPIVQKFVREGNNYHVEVFMVYSAANAKKIAREAAAEAVAKRGTGLGELIDKTINSSVEQKLKERESEQ